MTSSGSEDTWERMKKAALAGAKGQLHETIKNALPEGRLQELYASHLDTGYPRTNPEEDFDDEDFDEDFDEEGGPEESKYNLSFDSSLSFEFPDRDQNLDYAVAAYRLYGTPDCIVAQHPHTGMTFFGDPDDLISLCEQRDVNPASFEVLEDAAEIMNIETSYDAVHELVKELRSPDFEAAKEQFDKFHWGDKSRVATFTEIPGIEGDLTLLGVARQVQYGAKKGGSWQEYYHDFGENSGQYPMIYALGDKTLVIYGGQMRVEPRGIVE